MGRARKNQRDAIRKQRAKRRKKNNPSDDDDSDIDIDKSVSELASSREPVVSETFIGQAEGKSTGCEESKPSSATTEAKTARITTAKDASVPAPAKVPTIKKPVDRIERMRLKKQQQKARNKEKKVTREAAAAAAAATAAHK
jgi:hypothetical protein